MRLEILEFLYPFSSEGAVDIILFVKEKFPHKTRLITRDIICGLSDKKFIVGPDKNTVVQVFQPWEMPGETMQNLPDPGLNYKISGEGIKEVEVYKEKTSLEKLHDSIATTTSQ